MTMNRDTMLRIIICVDFVLITLVFICDWLPKSYFLTQITILALGFWSIVHRESAIQVELLMLIKCFSIILDPIAIGMYFEIGNTAYSTLQHKSYFVISAFVAIFYLILKPVMLVFLNKVRQDRLNDSAFGTWGPGSGYMSVDGQ